MWRRFDDVIKAKQLMLLFLTIKCILATLFSLPPFSPPFLSSLFFTMLFFLIFIFFIPVILLDQSAIWDCRDPARVVDYQLLRRWPTPQPQVFLLMLKYL